MFNLNLFVLSQDTPTCYPGQLSFNTSVNTTFNSVSYYTGTPTVCVNGNKLPICNGTSLDYYVVSSVCFYSTGLYLISKLLVETSHML